MNPGVSGTQQSAVPWVENVLCTEPSSVTFWSFPSGHTIKPFLLLQIKHWLSFLSTEPATSLHHHFMFPLGLWAAFAQIISWMDKEQCGFTSDPVSVAGGLPLC